MSSSHTNPGRALRRAVLLSALAGSLFAYDRALAQSTGTQVAEQEQVVVTGQKKSAVDGIGIISKAAKDQSIITADYIQTAVGSSNFAQLVNLTPGFVYSSEDATGVLSGDIRMHGFDGAHLSFTVDGTPLNDTGNYAIYPGEYAVSESIDHITVNTGQTEVDSPTASSIGGTINIITRKPSEKPAAMFKVSDGGYGYGRGYAEVETGAIGPTGLRTFLSANYVQADKWKGTGQIERFGIDGRLYQPLKGDDFVALAFNYASDRPYFYKYPTLSQINTYGTKLDYNTTWAVPTHVAGAADGVAGSSANPGQTLGADFNFWKLAPNPVDFADVRMQSRYTLAKNLIFTFDPYFFYTLANGGGSTSLKEYDPRLVGNAAAPACAKGGTGVDLNGDGDCLDTVLVYSPSNTQTHRFGLQSSLVYDLNDTNRFQLSYTYDHGRHRQTGEMTPIDQNTGTPFDVFGAKNGYGPKIYTADGSFLRKRDRFSIAELSQFSANYIGKFFDEKLHINIGARDAQFTRKLNQFCYLYNGTNEYCDTLAVSAVTSAIAADQTAHAMGGADQNYAYARNLSTVLFGNSNTVAWSLATGAPNFRMPFKQTYHFNKVLPNVGATYAFDSHNLVYVTYAAGFSAPKTDNLYSSSPELVKPETSDQLGAGYRYQGSGLTGSANLWYSTWKNRIVSSPDPNDPTLSIDRNIGDVHLYGLDLEGGWRATKELSFYASAAYTKSELQGNEPMVPGSSTSTDATYPNQVTMYLPTKGKALVLTPDITAALRAQYKSRDWTLGMNSRYVGHRFLTDMNDVTLAPYTTFDIDAEYRFMVGSHPTAVQFNVYNLLNKSYFVKAGTTANGSAVTVTSKSGTGTDTFSASTPGSYDVGAPLTAIATLKMSF